MLFLCSNSIYSGIMFVLFSFKSWNMLELFMVLMCSVVSVGVVYE